MSLDVEHLLSKAIGERYRIVRKIGSGAMGSVYLAEDVKLARKVAIKVLHPELSASVTGARFLREIRIAAGLAHPHIVPVHDSGEVDGLLYFVMRFEEGESLRALLDREGPLRVERAVSIARDVAEGLAHAHAHGVVHRDIKPANILVTGAHAVIADFGVARAVEMATVGDTMPAATSTALGTPLYMSPEQASASPEIDGRSDLYSLGCVLFEMLAGVPPYRGRSAAAVLASHFHKTIPSVHGVRPEVPPPLVEIVERALAKSPDERFSDADTMVRALESVRSGIETTGMGFRARWHWLPRRLRRRYGIALGLSLAVSCVLLIRFAASSAGPAADPSSMVVLPFRDAITTSREEDLLVALADEVTHQLNRWQSVSAVPQIALSGARFDLGIGHPALARVDEGLDLARTVRAGTLVSLTVRIRGDSAVVSASRIDVETGTSEGRPVEVRGEAEEPFTMAADIAHRILGLEGAPADIEVLRKQSGVPEALMAYGSGRRSLERWRLPEAEADFREALGLDSGFAMAHHLLAFTLFWEWADGLESASDAGSEIALESTRAVRNANALTMKDSLHILAFNRFQAGDYEAARELYRGLLQRDSTDVYAWLLQGSVESLDPWLTDRGGGMLAPRADLNVAWRSFRRVVQLSPGLQGAYGQIFQLASEVAFAADYRGAPGFEEPRAELLSPWAPRTPHKAVPFWPMYLDSLVWIGAAEKGAVPDSVADAGADRLLEESVELLRRWAAFEPDQPRAQEELTHWTLYRRSRLRGPQPPRRVDSLSVEAMEHATRALALTADTTQGQLFRLANLRLAAGEIEGAREALSLALGWRRTDPDPGASSAAANVLLFTGRPYQALKLLASTPSNTRYYPDSATGGLVDDGRAEPTIRKLQVLAATGVGGSDLKEAFRELQDRWAGARDRPVSELRLLERVTAPRIAIALSMAPDVLGAWEERLDLSDPVWAAVRPGNPDARADLQSALEAPVGKLGLSRRSYLLGLVAQSVRNDSLAVRLFSRLDSLVFDLDETDPGWGLLALSYLQRGRCYETLGDSAAAALFYRRFTEAWSDPDASQLLVEEARRRLAVLTE